MNSEGNEIAVIDYQMQKQKIYKQLCRGLIMNCAYQRLLDMVNENDERVGNDDFSLMKNTHLDLCGHKACFSEWDTYGSMELMRACGGHGYSAYAGILGSVKNSFPAMILEGENSILFL